MILVGQDNDWVWGPDPLLCKKAPGTCLRGAPSSKRQIPRAPSRSASQGCHSGGHRVTAKTPEYCLCRWAELVSWGWIVFRFDVNLKAQWYKKEALQECECLEVYLEDGVGRALWGHGGGCDHWRSESAAWRDQEWRRERRKVFVRDSGWFVVVQNGHVEDPAGTLVVEGAEGVDAAVFQDSILASGVCCW